MFKLFKFLLKEKIETKKFPNEETSRPCPECSEELERMDRCLNCGVDLTYYNGFCYAIDEAESVA